jgi:O-methyltransferase involved in polyketide biosynthesis
LTLRQTVELFSAPRRSAFAGSPETVANTLQAWFEGRAADGFNIHVGHPAQHLRLLNEVVPILQERGLFRTEYESETLRGNLGLPIPANRYTLPESERPVIGSSLVAAEQLLATS